ncbi:MAG: hypothetical protein E7504_01400 [Ruminococcus sp.]|nr:hypothetical protein [Ruminococcus sp.]
MSEEKNINLVLKHAEDDEKPILTLRCLVKQTKRVFVLWLVLAIVVGIVAGCSTFMLKTSNSTVQAMVEFTFDGVEKGKDPAGNEFDPTKIKSPVVLNEALAAVDVDVPVDNLRNNIKIKGIMPEATYQELTGYKSIFETGGSSALSAVKTMLGVSYHPTRFLITLSLDGTGIGEEQGVAVMDAILTAYRRYFFETYGYNDALGSAVLAVDYQEYDYERVIEVFDTTLNSAQKYVNTLAKQDGTNFRSVNTGYSFPDLVAALETIRSEDLDWLSSYVSVNNVTKDKEQLMTYYEYRIQSLQRTQAAAEANLASIMDSIASYQKDTILVMPGGSDGGNVSVGQASKQYDEMVKKKLEVQAEISQCTKDINYYQYRVEKLQETSTVTSKAQMEVLDKKLEALYTKITNVLDAVNTTADEYYENVAYVSACSVIAPATLNVSSRGTDLITAVVLAEAVLFALFAVIIVVRALAQQYRLNTGTYKETAVIAEKIEAAAETEKAAEPETAKTEAAKPVQKKGRK